MTESKEELESRKLAAEIAKLETERAEIGRPFFHRSGFWFALVPAAVAIVGLIFQYLDYQSNLRAKEADITAKAARIERLMVDLSQQQSAAKLTDERSKLVQEKTAFELEKMNAEVKTLEEAVRQKTDSLKETEGRIGQLVEQQFNSFAIVCDAAGAIASTQDWWKSEEALGRFDDPTVNLVKTTAIAKTIEDARKQFGILKDMENSRPEDLHFVVLDISIAARTAWEKERDRVEKIIGVRGKEFERRFKDALRDWKVGDTTAAMRKDFANRSRALAEASGKDLMPQSAS